MVHNTAHTIRDYAELDHVVTTSVKRAPQFTRGALPMMSTDIETMTTKQHERWLDAWQTSGITNSPFLHPAYARAVSRSGMPVVVGMDCEQRGFLPFQWQGQQGIPVGGRLADFSGAVWPEDLHFDGPAILNACNLRQWMMPNSIGIVAQTGVSYDEIMSPYIDLQNGVDGWFKDMQNRNSSTKKQVLRKARKLEREVGPIRLERHPGDRQLLERLLSWKNQQRRATGSIDMFQESWAKKLACDVSTLTEDGCTGVLDALYAGDSLLAVHLGLQAGNRLHWWVPAYNDEFSRYSPGLIMLFELARDAHNHGVTRIDLGPGDERYKGNVSNGAVAVRKSALHCKPLGQAAFRLRERAYSTLKRTPLVASLKRAQRGLRKQSTPVSKN